MISFIIPIYNNSGTIDKCLVSIFSQTFKDFEIIVVDNNSTDNTKKIVQEFDKIKCVFEPVPGRGAARNTGQRIMIATIGAMRGNVLKINEEYPHARNATRHSADTFPTAPVPGTGAGAD